MNISNIFKKKSKSSKKLILIFLTLFLLIICERNTYARDVIIDWSDIIDVNVNLGTTENACEFFDVAVDPSDNTIVAVGSLASGATINGKEYNVIGTWDGMIVKYTNDGKIIWVKQISGSYDGTDTNKEVVNSVAINSSGEIVIGGYTVGSSIEIDGETYCEDKGLNAKSASAFVAKLSTNGDVLFVDAISAATSTVTASVDIDNSGNIVAGGYFFGKMTVDDIVYPYAMNNNGFVMKYNSNGDRQWFKCIGYNASVSGTKMKRDQINSVSFDKNGNAIAVGVIQSKAAIGSADEVCTTTGTYDCITIKFDKNGEIDWYKNFGISSMACNAQDVVVDSKNNIYVSAKRGSGIDGSAGVIIKYNSDGDLKWSENVPYQAKGIEISKENKVICYGSYLYENQNYWDTTPLLGDGTYSSIIVEYDEESTGLGDIETIYQLECNTKNEFNKGTVDNNNDIIACGNIDFRSAQSSVTIGTGENATTYNLYTYAASIVKLTTKKIYYEIVCKVSGEGGSFNYDETVESGNDAKKDKIIIPDNGYKVASITINGKEINFTPDENGIVVLNDLDDLKNILEDKLLVVKFEKIETEDPKDPEEPEDSKEAEDPKQTENTDETEDVDKTEEDKEKDEFEENNTEELKQNNENIDQENKTPLTGDTVILQFITLMISVIILIYIKNTKNKRYVSKH